MSSKYNVWNFNYEFLGLDSGDEKIMKFIMRLI